MQLSAHITDEMTPKFTRAKTRLQAGAFRTKVAKWGLMLQGRVKANAAGRPGPRMVTGDYNRSITLTVSSVGGQHAAVVGTNKPQGRRLEFGFVGSDSLGRKYAQPPYPHFGPAKDKIAPEFEADIAATAKELLR